MSNFFKGLYTPLFGGSFFVLLVCLWLKVPGSYTHNVDTGPFILFLYNSFYFKIFDFYIINCNWVTYSICRLICVDFSLDFFNIICTSGLHFSNLFFPVLNCMWTYESFTLVSLTTLSNKLLYYRCLRIFIIFYT